LRRGDHRIKKSFRRALCKEWTQKGRKSNPAEVFASVTGNCGVRFTASRVNSIISKPLTTISGVDFIISTTQSNKNTG